MRLRTSHPHTALDPDGFRRKKRLETGDLGVNPLGKGIVTHPPVPSELVHPLQFSGRKRNYIRLNRRILLVPAFATETAWRCQNVVIWLSSLIGRRELVGLGFKNGPADRRELDP